MESHMFEHLHKLIDGLIKHGAEPGSPALKQVKQYLSTLEVASTADVPALSVDALDALGAFDALDTLATFDAVPSVASSPAAPAAADPSVVVLDDPNSSTFAAAVLPTAPSVTPAAPAAASPPTATLTTMAFLALVALRATLTADSPVVALDALVSHTAATDMALTGPGASANTLDALPHLPPTVATTATEIIPAAPDTSFTTGARAAALDNSEVMAPPAKRQRTNSLQDSNGNLVTRAHLSEAWGPFPFVMPHMVPTLLRRTFGRQFAFDDADLPEFLETLQTTKGFKSLTINVETTDSGVIASLDVVHRDGPELAKICKQLKDRLRLSKGYDGVVPGPLLFYYLATLSCVPIAQLSGTAIANMFKVVAGKGLGSLRFATKSGTRQKTKEELFVLVKNWLCDLSRFVIKGGSIKKALRMAARCRTAYLDKCKPKDSSDADVDTNLEADLDTNLDADLDPNGTFAVEMLRSNECHSRILLGIHVNELKVLLTYLPELMKGQGEDGEAAGRIDQ